jgi:hypothetical protein
MSETMDAKTIVGLVKKGLAKHSKRERIAIAVDEADARLEDNWWYIGVWPKRTVSPGYAYYGILAEVESELQEKNKLNVLLVPTFPPAKKKKSAGKEKSAKEKKKGKKK